LAHGGYLRPLKGFFFLGMSAEPESYTPPGTRQSAKMKAHNERVKFQVLSRPFLFDTWVVELLRVATSAIDPAKKGWNPGTGV
jgi:hypothetical protein